MSDAIRHLPGIEVVDLETSRLRTRRLMCGKRGGEPVLFLHGNLSSSTFWEETMLALPAGYHAVAVDQRGYGTSNPAALIDATRGFAEWADDAIALADHLGWRRFYLVGHSLGGCIGWALLARHAERILTVTLVAPGPPCGFGGSRGATGALNYNDGAGSGAALVHPTLVERLTVGEREITDPFFSPRAVMNRLYGKPPFRPKREEDLLTAMLRVHLGERQFPGDWRSSPHWPGFAPGDYGPINAMSPLYNQWVLPELLTAEPKPPLLWIIGADDGIVCDNSSSDIGLQGKLGLRSDWPGEDVFPPQPIRWQVNHALDGYEKSGGRATRRVIPDVGHSPYLEQPAEFTAALGAHLIAQRG